MAKIWTISRKSHHPIATFVRFDILFLQLLKRFSTHSWRTGVDNKDKQRPAITKSLIQSQFSGLHISPPHNSFSESSVVAHILFVCSLSGIELAEQQNTVEDVSCLPKMAISGKWFFSFVTSV